MADSSGDDKGENVGVKGEKLSLTAGFWGYVPYTWPLSRSARLDGGRGGGGEAEEVRMWGKRDGWRLEREVKIVRGEKGERERGKLVKEGKKVE